MKYYIMTDLEGVVGTDSFSQTRTSDTGPEGKGPSMKRLGEEVNACVRGIRAAAPDAEVHVFDGHGSGGLFPEDLKDCELIPRDQLPWNTGFAGYDSLLFVGQHAMAGTINAPLNHTYSSRHVVYYRLNGVFIGEFGMLALAAGLEGVPTIFLAGDDQATFEARMFVPKIHTVATKQGVGREKAHHRDGDEVLREIELTTASAVRCHSAIPPFRSLQAPFTLEIRYTEKLTPERRATLHPGHELVDDYTICIRAEELSELYRRS